MTALVRDAGLLRSRLWNSMIVRRIPSTSPATWTCCPRMSYRDRLRGKTVSACSKFRPFSGAVMQYHRGNVEETLE